MSPPETLLHGKHCLVLDDEFLIALDVQSLLEAAGAQVTCVASGGEALALIGGGAQRFDLAVLDVKLGSDVRTSLSVAAALAAAGTPFVFLTGMRGDGAHTTRFPHAPLVEKPYDGILLMDAVRQALATRRP